MTDTQTFSLSPVASGPSEDPVGTRMAVSQQTFARTPLAETLLHCEANGIASVGLSIARVEEEGFQAVRERLCESGVSVSSLNWVAGFTGYAGYRLNDTMTEASQSIRLASAIGARTLTVITGPQDGHILSHIAGTFVESMQELAEIAEFLDVELAIVPMTPRHSAKWTFLTSLRKAIDTVRRIDSPHVGLAVTTDYVREETDIVRLRHELAEAAPFTKLVRMPMAAFDRGVIPPPPAERSALISNVAIAAELDAAGYRGYYELSAWSGPASQPDAYERTLRACSGREFDSRPDRPSRPGYTAKV